MVDDLVDLLPRVCGITSTNVQNDCYFKKQRLEVGPLLPELKNSVNECITPQPSPTLIPVLGCIREEHVREVKQVHQNSANFCLFLHP